MLSFQPMNISSLKGENESLQQSLQAMSVKCSSLQADLNILIPLQSSLQTENDALRLKTKTLCDQNDTLQEQRARLENDNAALRFQLSNAIAQIEDLRFAAEVMTRDRLAENKMNQDEILRLNLLNANLLEQLDQIRTERRELMDQNSRLIIVVEDRNEKIVELEDISEKRHHELVVDNDLIERLQDENKALREEVDRLRGDLEYQQTMTADLQEEIRRLKELDFYIRRCAELDEEVARLRRALAESTRKCEGLETDLAAERASAMELQRKWDRAAAQIQALEQALDEQNASKCVVMLQADVLGVDNLALRRHNEDLAARLTRLEELILETNRLRDLHSKSDAATARLLEDYRACKAELEVERRRVASLEQERSGLREDLDKWRSNYVEGEQLVKQARQAQRDLDLLREEIQRLRREHAATILKESRLRTQIIINKDFTTLPPP